MSQKTTQKQPYIRLSQTSAPAFAKGIEPTPVPVEVLFDICRRPRFAGSEGERYIIEKYLDTLPGIREDAHGNRWLVITATDAQGQTVQPVTMFSAHTDTVHKATAANTPYKLTFKKGWLSAKGGGVLGADDGTGMWILLNLIKAQVPGLYIFHREEEIGGKGSTFIADQHASSIREMGIKHCIAFDRKGYSDVITHQGSRCCSNEFAQALADQLNLDTGFSFAPDDTGVFTDSANYTELIAECTNLSVGYFDQHTTVECQDVTFVTRLVNRLIALDYAALPAVRDPSGEDPEDLGWMYRYPSLTSSVRPTSTLGHSDLVRMVKNFPHEMADLISSMGWSPDDVAEDLMHTYGYSLAEIGMDGIDAVESSWVE